MQLPVLVIWLLGNQQKAEIVLSVVRAFYLLSFVNATIIVLSKQKVIGQSLFSYNVTLKNLTTHLFYVVLLAYIIMGLIFMCQSHLPYTGTCVVLIIKQ